MGIIGDLSRYREYAASEAMLNASNNPGGAGAGMGAAMGAAMGMGMAAGGPWGQGQGQQQVPLQNAAGATPPPLPGQQDAQWHVAIEGQAKGPFGQPQLQQMVTDGSLTRETLVWAQGRDGWTAAGEISELSRLFSDIPPPLPD